jgi:hypothetical protein
MQMATCKAICGGNYANRIGAMRGVAYHATGFADRSRADYANAPTCTSSIFVLSSCSRVIALLLSFIF